MARIKNPNVNMLPRSVRVEEKIWALAKQRAAEEGVTVSRVMGDLLEGYARGVYELPKTQTVKHYPSE